MVHGDFTDLAKYYINRPGYSLQVLEMLAGYTREKTSQQVLSVADVGAGTGKLTENLAQIGLSGYAVEPNDAMRMQGVQSESPGFSWIKGTAEQTGLEENSVEWVLMGSSFHWTDAPAALKEFHRILRPNGIFTAIWNPRDTEKNELQGVIEAKIKEIVPELVRVSSAGKNNTQHTEEKLLSSPYFKNLIFCEAPYIVKMDPVRYLNAWKSVNDIQVQAGPARFEQILLMIENEIKGMKEIVVPYRARAWSVEAVNA